MQNKYQSVFETTLDGIILIDNRGIIADINPAGLILFGYEKDEVLGKNINILMPEPDHSKHDQYIRNYQLTKKPKVIGIGREVEGKKKNGEVFPFRLAVSEFKTLGKQHFTGIIHDLTQQKLHEKIITGYAEELEQRVNKRTEELREEIALKELAQKALVDSQRLYETIAVNYPNGTISVIDSDHNIIFVEGSELEHLGLKKENLISKDYRQNIPTQFRELVSSKIKEVFSGANTDFEYGDGDRVYSVRCVPLSYEEGEVTQILIVENNISQQKKAENEIHSALKKEKQLNELKTNFVSMASHEFRTPLSSILSSAQLIGRYTSTDQQDNRKKHLEKIRKNVQSLTAILNDFLSLEKIEGGHLKYHPEKVNILEYVKSVVEESEPLLKRSRKINISCRLKKDHWEIDQYLLRNSLTNLLSNAIKYSQSDIYVNIQSADNLSISIQDSGLGISKKDQENLFKRFYRASNAGQIQGTGLGLNIVKRYVDLMQGEIRFESKQGIGSTFTIIL